MGWWWLLPLAAGLTGLRILWRQNIAASSRLAWVLVIVMLPLAGIALYLLFGEADLSRKRRERAQGVEAALAKAAKRQAARRALPHGELDPLYSPAFAAARSVNGFGVVGGNTAELMADAGEARRRLIEDIDAARHSVNVLYYIWLEDRTGTDVAQALIRAAQRGVTCRAMADGLGSRAMVGSRLWADMKQAGVKTVVALPLTNVLKTLALSRIDLRNHRKITVIDDAITYCGSQNCADEAFLVKKRFAPWVDIMVRLTGPVAMQSQLLFATDWVLHTDDTLDMFEADAAPEVEPKDGGTRAVVWGDGPTSRKGVAQQLISTLAAQARHRLTISTPYFVPGEVVLESICAAAHRGVEVSLILPLRNDSWIVSAASRSNYNQLLEAGVTIFEHSPGLLHSKTFVVDGTVGLIGSSNLDLRSFDLNYENNILFEDPELAAAIEARQQSYIAASRRKALEELTAISIPKRIWYNIVATVGPVL